MSKTDNKNSVKPTVINLLGLINYQEGAVVSREVLRKRTGTITLFAFEEAQGLSEYTAPFDAVANVLEGDLEITISGSPRASERLRSSLSRQANRTRAKQWRGQRCCRS